MFNLLGGKNIVYRGTISDLRISAVDGTAFVDAASAITSYADGNHEISIYDASGYKLVGVLKAAGSGETLGSELVTNGGFDTNTTGWSAGSSALLASVADGESGNCLRVTENGAADPYASITAAVTQHSVYRFSYAAKQGTSSTYRGYLTNNSFIQPTIPTASNRTSTGEWVTQGPFYTTAIGTGSPSIAFKNITTSGSGQTHFFDSVTLKKVTAPSSDGATIVSTKGGATYNFTSKNASFTYNAASYRVVVRKMR